MICKLYLVFFQSNTMQNGVWGDHILFKSLGESDSLTSLLSTTSWKKSELETTSLGPDYGLILEGREQCPAITVTPLMTLAFCSKNRSGYNLELIDLATLCASVFILILYTTCKFVWVNMFVCEHVCVGERNREWGREGWSSTVSEGVTIRSPSHS